jgi:hypothetical protein
MGFLDPRVQSPPFFGTSTGEVALFMASWGRIRSLAGSSPLFIALLSSRQCRCHFAYRWGINPRGCNVVHWILTYTYIVHVAR